MESGNPQHIRMIMNQRSSPVYPAISNRARSVISISDADIEESMTEPDTDLDPENQLGLPENRGWVDRHDVSDVSEASGKHWIDCRLMKAEYYIHRC